MMRRQVAVGSIWSLVQSLSHRALTITSQLILAWLLVPEQFGIIGIANGLATLVYVLGQLGISEILINRYRKFHLWGPVSNSLMLMIGLFTALFMLILAVVASILYDSSVLGWVLAIFALSAPIQASSLVAESKLKAEMRFRSVALISMLSTTVSVVTSIALATLGFGAYSIAWGRPVESLVRATCTIRVAQVGFLSRITFRGWRYLVSDCFHSYLTTICNIAIHQCDYLILGLFATKAAVGIYFMSFTLSSQALSFIVLNLVGVLYPALARLADDRVRLARATLESSKVLAFVSVPICALLMINAEAFIPVFLEPKWLGVIPLVKLMSVGAAFRSTGWLWRSQLKAQGKFAEMSRISGISAAICLGIVTVSSYYGGVVGCTLGISLYYVLASPIQLYLTMRNSISSPLVVADLFIRPVAIAALAFGGGWLAAGHFRDQGAWFQEMVVQTVLGAICYVLLSWLLNNKPFTEILNTFEILRSRSLKSTSQ